MRATIAVDDIATATVTVVNNVPDSVQRMVLVDIGLPPGFDLVPYGLNEAVAAGRMQRWENPGRQLILYVEKIEYGTPWTVNYELRARFPMEGSSGSASVRPYYQPEVETSTGPTAFVVTEPAER